MTNINERSLIKDTVLSVGLIAIAMIWLALAAGSGAVHASDTMAEQAQPDRTAACAAGAAAPAARQSVAVHARRDGRA